MERLGQILIVTAVWVILIATARTVFLLFWTIQEKRKTWLWSYIDYLKFYLRFKIRWMLMGGYSIPEQNAKILHWTFSDPKGPSYKHRFSKRAAKVVKAYIEDVF